MPVEQLPGLERTLLAEERAAEPTPAVESTVAKSPSEYTQRGEFLRRVGNLDDALKELEAALEVDHDDAYALATKGRILRAQGRSDDAAELLEQAICLDPGLDWVLLELTDLLCELGRQNDAEERCKELLKAHSEDAPTHGTYGRLLRQMGEFERAAACLERAVELRPDLAWLHAQLGEVLRRQGHFRRALESCSEAERVAKQKSLSGDVTAWILTRKGLCLMQVRRYGEAVEALTRALALAPHYTLAMRRKAQALWESNKREECFSFLEHATTVAAEPTWAYIELANYARDMGLLEEALEVLDECLVEDPNSVQLLIRKGELLHRVGDFEGSVRILGKAEELDEKNSHALQLKASALKYLGKEHNEEALATIERALESAGKEPALLIARADILRARGDAAAAEQDYRGAVEQLDVRRKERPQSMDAATLWLMGWCWLWLGENDLAFRLLAHAKSLDPDLYIVRFFLGLALLIRGEMTQAKREYDAALEVVSGKSALLRRGILRSSLYALQVARTQQEISPQDTAEQIALGEGIEGDLEGELENALAEIANDGYDLRLMSVNATDDLEDEGRHLAIVAFVGTKLHIRVFDASGEKVVDKAESELVGGETLTALKQRLSPLPDESVLSQKDKQEIIDDATSIAGHSPNNQSKGASSIRASRSTEPPASVEQKDDAEASDVVPYVNLLVRPTADPMVPMIRLDHELKILDWNIAASLAFDGTLEGRRGQWVGDWIVHSFDNPLPVLDHGQTAFQGELPLIDVEEQQFTSNAYGQVDMTKRAFRIPDDKGSYLGWLLIFELRFSKREYSWKFRKQLIDRLNSDNIWSAHALSYEAVLSSSLVYDELLRTLIGEIGPLQRIPNGARVLDLGAGTGALTLKLVTSLRDLFIVAVDINNAMLDILQDKCKRYMCGNQQNHGVVAIRQDISKLSGVLGAEKDLFDCAFLVNVLNTLREPEEALKGVFELLKPGGEIRITGPRDDSRVEVLFDALKDDLEKQGLFEELKPYYEDLRALNADQLSETFRWTTADVEQMLLDVGFSKIINQGDSVRVYAGQGMLVAARR